MTDEERDRHIQELRASESKRSEDSLERVVRERKGFVEAPDMERLKPTPEEQERLRRILEWQDASARSTIMLGVPPEDQAP